MQSSSILAQPLKIGELTADGRVFKTATSETRATEDGFVSDELLDFYRPIAQAGTPLIITGNLYVTEEGKSTYRMCGADYVDKIKGLSQWADLVHCQGGLLFGQINHCGRQVMARAMGLDSAVSASDVKEKVMGVKPRPLTQREIKQAAEDYVRSAEICEQAGFDGVQIHAGHGYLINQFLTPYTNRRDDQYGGSFVKRLRLLLEIYWGIRERTNLTVIMKINGADYLPGRQGLSTAQLVEVARILQEEGLDALEVTVGHYESGFPMIRGNFGPFFKGLMEEGIGPQLPWFRRFGITCFRHPLAYIFDHIWPAQEGFNLHYAREFKKKLSIPVICVGGFLTREHMEQAIDGGACDAVSVGRAMIADPYLFRNILNGENGPKCSFCNACIARAGRLPVDCYDPEVNPVQQQSCRKSP
ncbi:Predicted NADH:flavin oxidoreductase/NADH oxidase [Desulfatibacillum aliphaticivorans]|uniref:Predicted NADH:flavin oxidoreductase/NADH oxidase n=1 Tax=Desulfatibacillum aliphaticivorans TaxID=218208 RepID=B8F9B4_DESAL|nr:NADH:flavin oxidoreductase [Desulfatibacillum aliphaticivorans]ACL02860.1 Predicted NADH:flavin oxidoreductase/NADH oxidase [Desulfatibacillum aliphaticivorans]